MPFPLFFMGAAALFGAGTAALIDYLDKSKPEQEELDRQAEGIAMEFFGKPIQRLDCDERAYVGEEVKRRHLN